MVGKYTLIQKQIIHSAPLIHIIDHFYLCKRFATNVCPFILYVFFHLLAPFRYMSRVSPLQAIPGNTGAPKNVCRESSSLLFRLQSRKASVSSNCVEIVQGSPSPSIHLIVNGL